LVQTDPRNLFFRYLLFRVNGVLNPFVARSLLIELLSMRQFPQEMLPRSCDRKADYLWQRSSREYDIVDDKCSYSFHGTDFVWMAGLLVEELRLHENKTSINTN
jgi:hypothetical protein